METNLNIEQITPELVWTVRHEVLYPDLGIEAVKLEDDFIGTHFGAFTDNKLAGVVSVYEDGDKLLFRKFSVRGEFQNKKIGSQLMEYILNHAKSLEKTAIWCNARASALYFYKKFGFVPNGKTFTKNGINFMTIEKEI
ncbi:GNAT family N-acetyltransferase [Pseudopedobacter sp.]|uniref:GNAT family N-acetyltransferase n=1 Tax=Pseudopedobacter sp. TaxID=1936787 RepID=UPI0033405EC6